MPTREECANALRALSIDAIEKAKSGHPGAPLGMADMAEALWRHFFRHNPADPAWPNRDRFVLSNGHASALLYALLHLTGYDLSMEDIKNFRQLNSKTPGHPEKNLTPGVEMTTGPLGQGLASAVGMALAEAMLGTVFNKPGHLILDHYTYAFCGDGCLMEGVSHEACSLAGTWRLGRLIVFYDSNDISIDGKISPWFGENIAQTFASYNWHVIGPIDGHDADSLDNAIKEAQAVKDKPSFIICKTSIGYGSEKAGQASSHGAPLGAEAAKKTKENLGWNYPEFSVPDDVSAAWNARPQGDVLQKKWDEKFAAYAKAYPDLAKEFTRRMKMDLPENWEEVKKILLESINDFDAKATRVASRDCLEVLVPRVPSLIGGSADLSSSTGSKTAASVPLNPENYTGNYLYYGAREFGMGAIMNGLALHGGFIPYAGTFLSFTDQAKNAIRLCALMRLRVIWVMTHDSIAVGEDGPTHQPVEQIPALRLVPNLNVWRPCDSFETAVAWISALESATTPTCLALSRQTTEQFPASPERLKNAVRGGYVLKDCEGVPEIIIISSGSEMGLAAAARNELEKKGHKCRLVSMPCQEIFDGQDEAWRDSVLPPKVECRIAVEAAAPDLWAKYVGLRGVTIGVNKFGKSAPAADVAKEFGFTVENVVARAEKALAGQK